MAPIDPETLNTVGTASAVGAGAYVTKDALNKFLGPTAEYLGEKLLKAVTKVDENLCNVIAIGYRKLGDQINIQGSVPPRVLKHVVDEAQYCEDELLAEYLGGILASSRTEGGIDDRAVHYLSILRNLSSYQIRFHCLCHILFKKIFDGQDVPLTGYRGNHMIYIPYSVFIEVLGIEDKDPIQIADHCVNGLHQYKLLGSPYFYGSPDFLKKQCATSPIKEAGMIVIPSAFGAEMFLWASGYTGMRSSELFLESTVLEDPVIVIPDGCIPVTMVMDSPSPGVIFD